MDKELEEARRAFDMAGRAWVDAGDDGMEERESFLAALARLHRATLEVAFEQAERKAGV